MELLRENERSASIAAAKVMRITILVFALVVVLDILGIFVIDLGTMFAAFGISTALLLIPTPVIRMAKQGAGWVKYVILARSVVICVSHRDCQLVFFQQTQHLCNRAYDRWSIRRTGGSLSA